MAAPSPASFQVFWGEEEGGVFGGPGGGQVFSFPPSSLLCRLPLYLSLF